MEFHRGNTNGDETTASASGEDQRYGWSEEYQCKTIDGYLAPTPLSSTPLDEEDEGEEEHEQPQSSKKKRKTKGDEEFFFRLFTFVNVVDQYLLEMHEVRNGSIARFYLSAKLKIEGMYWTVDVRDLASGTYVVFPVLHDPYMLQSPPNDNLSLQDRLRGWTLERREREKTGKIDKLYYHDGKQFRSLVEVITFILYTTNSQDELKFIIRNRDPATEDQLMICA